VSGSLIAAAVHATRPFSSQLGDLFMTTATTVSAAPDAGSPLAWLAPGPATLSHVELADLYDASDGLPHLAAHAGAALEGCSPETILRWAIERFGERFAVASSMGDAVLAHMASRIRPGVPVVFLDTGYHFAETLGTADAVEATLPVKLVRVRPSRTVAEQDASFGRDLFARDPDTCCRLRKVLPLRRALAPYVAWATGIRRDESVSRSGTRVVEWDSERSMVKVNPLAGWTQDDLDRYVAANHVLVNPLLSEGYGSIGCAPCTLRGTGRAGRWAGSVKTECGLHL
jgi:phosphoadenosine phosphosulfate reductase